MSEDLMNLLIGLLFFIPSAFFLTITIMILYFNNKVKNWREIKGNILSLNLNVEEIDDNRLTDEYSGGVSKKYNLKITFEYELEGISYISEKIYYSKISSILQVSKQVKKSHNFFSKRKSVSVIIDPKNPKKGFLIKRMPVLYNALAFLCTFIAGILLIYYL